MLLTVVNGYNDSWETGIWLLIDLKIDGFDPLVIVSVKAIPFVAANMSSPVEPIH